MPKYFVITSFAARDNISEDSIVGTFRTKRAAVWEYVALGKMIGQIEHGNIKGVTLIKGAILDELGQNAFYKKADIEQIKEQI